MFINDIYPRAVSADGSLQTREDWKVVPTKVMDRASIGSNATILAGMTTRAGSIIWVAAGVLPQLPVGRTLAMLRARGNSSRKRLSRSPTLRSFLEPPPVPHFCQT